MNQSGQHFYCVSCSVMVPVNSARVLFRTGFFRHIHPMGCCVSCMAEAEKEAEGSRERMIAAGEKGAPAPLVPLSAAHQEMPVPALYYESDDAYLPQACII